MLHPKVYQKQWGNFFDKYLHKIQHQNASDDKYIRISTLQYVECDEFCGTDANDDIYASTEASFQALNKEISNLPDDEEFDVTKVSNVVSDDFQSGEYENEVEKSQDDETDGDEEGEEEDVYANEDQREINQEKDSNTQTSESEKEYETCSESSDSCMTHGNNFGKNFQTENELCPASPIQSQTFSYFTHRNKIKLLSSECRLQFDHARSSSQAYKAHEPGRRRYILVKSKVPFEIY